MTCMFFSSDSLDAKTYSILESYEIHLQSYYLPFPVCSVSLTFQQKLKPISFKKREDWILQLALEKISRTKNIFKATTTYNNLQSEQKSCGQETLTRLTEGLLYHGSEVYPQCCMSYSSEAAVM